MNTLVSIVIPSYKRKTALLNLLTSLSREKQCIFEVIVVEQKDNNGVELRSFAKERKLKLRYYYLLEPCTTHAMNVGVRAAKGEYILFLDDDVIVQDGLINYHLQNFCNPQVTATCGRCITRGQPIESQRNDTGHISFLGTVSDGFSSTIKQKIDTVIGCNAFWRKDVLEQLGGMDEQFTGNAIRFESDLSLRAKDEGYIIIFEPKALVYHLREETGGARKTEGRTQWYFDYFSNETYFFLKHRAKVLLPLFLITKVELALRCMLGFGREVSFRSLTTPFRGVIDGVKKYNKYSYDHRR